MKVVLSVSGGETGSNLYIVLVHFDTYILHAWLTPYLMYICAYYTNKAMCYRLLLITYHDFVKFCL